jgi:tight adherence protein B
MQYLLSLTVGIGLWLTYEGLARLRVTEMETTGGRRTESLWRSLSPDIRLTHFVPLAILFGVAASLLTETLLGRPLVSALGGILGAYALIPILASRRERQRLVRRIALADASAQLRDLIRAGLSPQDALTTLGRIGPEELRGEFERLAAERKFDGFPRALAAMRERLSDPLFDQAAKALLIGYELGGTRLTPVLDRLEQATRAELRVQAELRAYQKRNVYQARVIAALPLGLVLAISKLNPDYLAPLGGLGGDLALAYCVLSTVVGYRLLLWVTRLPDESRVLA